MSSSKVTDYTEITSPSQDDVMYIVDVSSSGDGYITIANLNPAFGEIYANDVSDELTISSAGEANRVQVTSFNANGLTNKMTADHAQDHIIITEPGKYLCTISLVVESAAGGGTDHVGASLYKNNGTTEFPNVHTNRKLAGGGGDTGSISMSGIIDTADNDTIELWLWNADSTDNIVVDDVTLSLVQVGGT